MDLDCPIILEKWPSLLMLAVIWEHSLTACGVLGSENGIYRAFGTGVGDPDTCGWWIVSYAQ